MSFSEKYQVIVIGGGHAGIEASLAAARLGLGTLCLVTDISSVGNMPCNPSIGGTAKGQLVREIDALGGEMAKAADYSCIQYRMLNRGKGPAVHSPRSQADRDEYKRYMLNVMLNTPNLTLLQGECNEILTGTDGKVSGVALSGGISFECDAVIIATGTFLKAKTFSGNLADERGPDGMYSANKLSANLEKLGLTLRRFKTGTPPRLSANTIDFSATEVQPGEDNPQGFSFTKEHTPRNIVSCWLTYTNDTTHEIIRASLDRSPLFGGRIEGIGPRYCPSIEDKIVRFSDKPRHQLFLEPCNADGTEIYLQGMSTSMPHDVQIAFVNSVKGLEKAKILRFGYAIEYDCLDPLQLSSSLAVKHIPGLYAAGQICGSSGYEEAAAQGLIAGINAVRYIQNKPSFTLQRSHGYIATLIDDLVTKGTSEPYRMMTSRCEYRLIARQDNADTRLMPLGREIGLINEKTYSIMKDKYNSLDTEITRLEKTIIPPGEEINALLTQHNTAPIANSGVSLLNLLKRPELDYSSLAPIDKERQSLSPEIIEQIEITAKYDGYISRINQDAARQKKMEDYTLSDTIDYLSITSLRLEAREKLNKIRPETLGQAGRISGVSPSDINALIVWLSKKDAVK